MADTTEQSKKGFPKGPIVLLLLVLAGAVYGYSYWKEAQHWEGTDDAQIEGRIYRINAKVGGTIAKLSVEENQHVEAGAVVAEIDPRDYQVAVDQAKADLAQAEADVAALRNDIPIISNSSSTQLSGAKAVVEEATANVTTAERQVEAAQSRLATAEAMIRQAKANHERAARDVERYRALVAKEEISKQQFDTATTAEVAAQAQVDAAQAQLEEARQAIRVAQQQVAQYRARVTRAETDVRAAGTGPQQVSASEARVKAAVAKVQAKKAELEKAQLNLEYTIIKAPASGVVSQRDVETGQILQAGQPVMAIVPLEDIWVIANYKESQLASIKVGQKAEVSVDAYGGTKLAGHVESIAAATGARFSLLPPENATGNFVKVVQRVPVKIVFDGGHPERVLRPGMSVVPKIRIQ